MPEYPFTFDYIGLGLLDEASIRRDHDGWAADYRDAAGSPYLKIHLGASRVRIEEFDTGRRVALTVAPSITQAIGMHGSDALGQERSRFWERVAASTPLAWVQTACSDGRYSFIPAMGIGRLCLPLPADVDWHAPGPGPIARRIGLRPLDDAVEIGSATLMRFAGGGRNRCESRSGSSRSRFRGSWCPRQWLPVSPPMVQRYPSSGGRSCAVGLPPGS